MAVTFDFTTLPALAGASSLEATGINDFGVVIGAAIFPKTETEQGFIYFQGKYYTFKAPPYCEFTSANALNNVGGATGTNQCGPGVFSNWSYGNGRFQIFVYPSADEAPPTGINDFGVVVGQAYQLFSIAAYRYTNGQFTSIDIPGASITSPEGINDLGQIVGSYCAGTGPQVAYVQTNGVVTTLKLAKGVPNAAMGINNLGEIVGTEGDYGSTEGSRGFVAVGNVITTVTFPGAVSTKINGVNDTGQIVGNAMAPDGSQSAFVGTPRRP